MLVSVILATKNGLPHILEQLDALAAQKVDAPWEVIVADNGSSDGTIQAAEAYQNRFPKLTIFEASSFPGQAYARNEAVKRAAGRLLVFLDDDDLIGPGYVQTMVHALERRCFVASRLDANLLNPQWARVSRPVSQATGLDDPYGFLPCAAGCSLGIRREVFDAVGGFDPMMRECNDIDFCWRVQRSGWQLDFVPEAVVHYRYRYRLREIFRQASAYGEAGPRLYRRYGVAGMPRRAWRRATRFQLAALYRLLQARSRGELAAAVFLIGLRVGMWRGCIRYRVFYL